MSGTHDLNDSQAVLQGVVDSLQAGITVVDRNFNVHFVNQLVLDLIDADSAKDVIGKRCFNALFGRDSPCEWCSTNECFETGEIQRKEASVDTPDGLKHYAFSSHPAFSGKCVVCLGVELSTDQGRVSFLGSEIEEAKTHLESILDTIEESICVIDRDLEIISFNDSFAKNTDTPREKILGRKCYRVLHGYSEDEFSENCKNRCIVLEAFETGRTIESVHQHDTERGQLFHESRALPTRNTMGESYQIVYVLNDVTEKKEAEQTLREYADRLERSNNLKDLFADIMRHDLLNPLGVVKNVFELIEEDLPDTGMEREIAMVKRNIAKIEDLVHSAARFGQVESAKDMEFENRNLKEILEEVVSSLSSEGLKKDMKIMIFEEDYYAETSPFIEDVFSNLITNAIKYSPPGSTIDASCEDLGDKLMISISDRGMGVPDEHKQGIFERFKRVEKGSVKGSGLGLAIVKRVVELHKGDVWVEDRPDGGSTFTFTLPKKRVKDA
ncbi:sensor histidine kinase TodS [archaeon BMS3Abin16]|nr:sensor histidine kinase TodS [archaeon BMS3Abin16]